ncbi:DevA family ABC transporter ATP-binding protein [Prochlorococcus marinus]|uniref:ABC transporter, ATP-binding component n=1 Tax=Prochlorococcus marinus (strain MIT 9211) TaxID=93059 RepID=A9BAT2_PROM4|nr:DevA family ABC transporter ATP-binding protein [Prochlorococcus marinus]ABX08944.1 ABC transporter, ATP-binding component [Prochlorococcus marinus str. MIT 9211]
MQTLQRSFKFFGLLALAQLKHKSAIPLTVQIKDLSHWFGNGSMKKQVLHSISLEISPGEVVLLTGPSGCGKTTLLTLIGALRNIQHGDLKVLGHQLRNSSRKTRQRLRRNIGMIFQGHNLLRCLTAEQNVQIGSDLLASFTYEERRAQARQWLEEVGLQEHMSKLPHDLSGGQKQRVAIARALAARPKLLLADEPTAALDSATGREIVSLLKRLALEQSCAVLMVTHDPRILDVADRLLKMEDGRLLHFLE